MIIAIPSTGTTLESNLDARFGRSSHFIFYNSDTDDFTVKTNEQNRNAVSGAGIQTAEMIHRSGADALITVRCGPKAFQVLKAAGIEVFLGPESTVKKAIEDWKAGTLKKLESPNS